MVQDGKQVKVHYTGTLEDGSVFDSSEGRDPLEFSIGSSQVIPGFESAVREMAVGETKKVTIPCQEAYGDVRKEMIATIPSSDFPDTIKPEVGMVLQMQTDQGPLPLKVLEISDEGVTVDGNHPLAGKDLTFDLTLVEIC
jgi:peptidylprolyl isomerase